MRNGWAKAGLWAGAAVLAATGLSGCQSVAGSSPETMVRVIDASYNAPAVDVDVATTPIAENIGSGTITNYAFLPPENATASVYPTGTKKATAQASGQMLANGDYSVLLEDSGAGYTATLLSDESTAPPSGDIALRFIEESPAAGAVDVYLVPGSTTVAAAKPLLTNLTVNSVSDYETVPAGTYTVVVLPTGETPTASTSTTSTTTTQNYASTNLQLTAGAAETVVIMDSKLTATPPVTLVVGTDRE